MRAWAPERPAAGAALLSSAFTEAVSHSSHNRVFARASTTRLRVRRDRDDVDPPALVGRIAEEDPVCARGVVLRVRDEERAFVWAGHAIHGVDVQAPIVGVRLQEVERFVHGLELPTQARIAL